MPATHVCERLVTLTINFFHYSILLYAQLVMMMSVGKLQITIQPVGHVKERVCHHWLQLQQIVQNASFNKNGRRDGMTKDSLTFLSQTFITLVRFCNRHVCLFVNASNEQHEVSIVSQVTRLTSDKNTPEMKQVTKSVS